MKVYLVFAGDFYYPYAYGEDLKSVHLTRERLPKQQQPNFYQKMIGFRLRKSILII